MSPDYSEFFVLSQEAAHLTDRQKTAMFSVFSLSQNLAYRYGILAVLKNEKPYGSFVEDVASDIMQTLKLLSDSETNEP